MRVSDGIRTRDRLDHNQELYQLSYAHRAGLNLATDRVPRKRRPGRPIGAFALGPRARLELPDVGQDGLESLAVAAQVVVLVLLVEELPRLERLEAVAA